MNCQICKEEVKTNGLYPALRIDLKKRKVCHSCDIWLTHWQQRNDKNVLRISGNHYIMVDDGTGIELTVRRNGKLVTVHAWHQGVIPQVFRNALPDNASYARRIQVATA